MLKLLLVFLITFLSFSVIAGEYGTNENGDYYLDDSGVYWYRTVDQNGNVFWVDADDQILECGSNCSAPPKGILDELIQ